MCLKCDGNGSMEHGTWDGRTLVHPQSVADTLGEDKTHLMMKLNSYRNEKSDHLYAITLMALQIKDRQLHSRVTVSGYAKSSAVHSKSVGKLALDTRFEPFQLTDLSAQMVDVQDVDSLQEEVGGRFRYSTVSSEALQLSATIDLYGERHVLTQQYIVPNRCFSVHYRCFWSSCGPSWAHYACNFQCRYQTCSNTGECSGWSPTPSTIQCSALLRFCTN